jgi:ornithine cyclodeaminase/alanine dehydrogenase-like protein (mu-crystallin family)
MAVLECLYISADETRALVGPDDALRVAEQVCRWKVEEREVWPKPDIFNLRLREPSATYRIKMAALTAVPIVGVRVTGYSGASHSHGSGAPDNTRFVVLSDPASARPLAIVDEHWTYILRTCASGVLGMRQLANPESSVLGIVGAGRVAATCLEMLAAAFPLRQVRVTSGTPESRATFCQQAAERFGLPVEARDTAREVAEGADLVLTATNAGANLIFDGWLKDGATLCCFGQHEAHPAVYRAVDKVVVSDFDVVREAPDVSAMIRDCAFSVDEIWSDLPDIVTACKPGRVSPRERILIRASGLVTQDVALCHFVYQQAVERGLGTRLPVG